MSNRTFIFFTFLVICGILTLFSFNLTNILNGQHSVQIYLKHNHVRGISISHNRMLYNLNFKQQNTVIDILNLGIPIDEIPQGQRQPPNIDKLVIYLFQDKPHIELIPITYVNQNLIFSVPSWISNGYFMERSEGGLQELLSQAYD